MEKFKRICDEKIREGIDKAVSEAKCANGVAAVVQKDRETLVASATQKQIDSLFKIVWWLIGVVVVESLGFGMGMLYLVLNVALK
jgi:uncharacterized membrane protein